VFGHAVAGLFAGHAPQPFRGGVGGFGHRRADAVHLRLGSMEKLALRGARGDGQVTGLLDGKQVVVHKGFQLYANNDHAFHLHCHLAFRANFE
jgi:hypothetical protein